MDKRLRIWQRRGFMPVVMVIGLVALAPRLFTKQIKAMVDVVTESQLTEWYQVVEGSIYDGDTLRVERGGQELKIRFCGTDSPEIEQPGGIEAREHLRSLVAQGDGSIGVVPIEKDRYGRTVADLFVIRPDGSEIHLNSQMVMDGMAYYYEKYSSRCPQVHILTKAEKMAREKVVGVWANPSSEKPWAYRKRDAVSNHLQ